MTKDESTTHHRPHEDAGAGDGQLLVSAESDLSGPGRCRWKDKGTIDREVDEHDATVSFALVDHHGVSTRDIPVTVCGNCTVIY